MPPLPAHYATPGRCPQASELRSMAHRAATFVPDVIDLAAVFSDFDALKAQLPRDALHKLTSISEMVDRATNEAATADAALEAVSRVSCRGSDAPQHGSCGAAMCADLGLLVRCLWVSAAVVGLTLARMRPGVC